MSFTSLDYKIMVSGVIFVVLMSFIGPAVGMAADDINATDIPDFSLDSARFDFVGELPEYPSEPSSGVLNATSDRFDDYRGQTQIELGPGDDGNRTFLVSNTSGGVWITDVEAGTINDEHVFTSTGEIHELNAQGYTIKVHAANLSRNFYEWQATERPDDSSLPLIGGALNLADAVAAGLVWIGSTIVVLAMILVEGVANTGGVVFDIVVFGFNLLSFILTNYLSVVAGAPAGFAKILVSLPGIVLSIEFGRVGLMILGKLPGIG